MLMVVYLSIHIFMTNLRTLIIISSYSLSKCLFTEKSSSKSTYQRNSVEFQTAFGLALGWDWEGIPLVYPVAIYPLSRVCWKTHNIQYFTEMTALNLKSVQGNLNWNFNPDYSGCTDPVSCAMPNPSYQKCNAFRPCCVAFNKPMTL